MPAPYISELCADHIMVTHLPVWTHLSIGESSGVLGDVIPPALRPLPVIQPQLAAVLGLAGRDPLVDGLILTADQQELLPPPVSVQTEEDERRKINERRNWERDGT